MKKKDSKKRSSKDRALSLEEFVTKTSALLELEWEAELAQSQEAFTTTGAEKVKARGQLLPNLRCVDAEGGLLGRTLLTLRSNKGGGTVSTPLPEHKFSPHDVVDLRPSKAAAGGEPLASGVVYRVHDDSIIVAVDEVPDDELNQPLRLEKLANKTTHNRMKDTLEGLARDAAQGSGSQAPLIDVAFGGRSPRFVETPVKWSPSNAGLDESQQHAVERALQAEDVALIHGPPGTGKTTAVVELILQEVKRGSRVLATAASNIAVDNLVERLATASRKLKLLRLGHPARLLPQVLDSSLEAQVLRSDNSSLARDCRREMKAKTAQLAKLGRKDYAERRALRGDVRALAKEERKRQELAIKEVVKGAQVVCATLTGVLGSHLRDAAFDVVVIDEAAQALEVACWGALRKGRRAVLAGDHLQLPPTVLSDKADRGGLGNTLFERLQGLHGECCSVMLTTQYRMNELVMNWSSRELYGGELMAHSSVAAHAVSDLKGVTPAADPIPVLLLIDTAGCDMEETAEDGGSKANEGEAKVVWAHVKRLIAAGVGIKDIGIITPYNAQVALLRELRPESLSALEVNSIDGFQGREKEAVIISMVRSNSKGEVGFLGDRRRMNVAVTRARRHCALVCDSETVSKDAFLGRLVQYFEDNAEIASASELVP